VLIHGHGEGTLKAAVRDALRSNCPYDVRFRAGLDQEGGDGVTIVALK
jgi:dsDNA-specific endonuclease/ATPase MutS2